MTVNEHILEFGGKRVEDWEPGNPLPDPKTVIPRVTLDYEESQAGKRWSDKLGALLSDPASRGLEGIVVGQWGEVGTGEDTAELVVQALVSARGQLPNLKAIFLGDITFEESEISWIQQTDTSPLLNAYAELEHFCVRGGEGLDLGVLNHQRLKTLMVQTGGLDRDVVREVTEGNLPALEHLELWLGDENYGANTTIDDLAPILSGNLFPNLKYLGLCDSELADEIAMAIISAPVLDRIEVLDLSMGTLSDAGAAALLASPRVARLRKLDIHFHYCSEEMVAKLKALPIEVDASEPQEPDEDDGEIIRYVAVGE